MLPLHGYYSARPHSATSTIVIIYISSYKFSFGFTGAVFTYKIKYHNDLHKETIHIFDNFASVVKTIYRPKIKSFICLRSKFHYIYEYSKPSVKDPFNSYMY